MTASAAPPHPTTPHLTPGRLWAVIPCAGSGTRAGTAVPKQYHLLQGVPLVAHTLAAFSKVDSLALTVVALAPEDTHYQQLGLPDSLRVRPVRCGGATRAQTVTNALGWLQQQGAQPEDWVLVHDAARCLITPEQIQDLIEACSGHEVGGLLAQRIADTVKQGSPGQGTVVTQTIDRDNKWLAQTPQMFRLGRLAAALQSVGASVTDEASAIEAMGQQPLLVQTQGSNFKLTYPDDFVLASALLAQRQPNTGASTAMTTMTIRIGQGWDTHALVAGRPLVLGGVTIPHTAGLMGHSDADALTHAVIDALLGAAGLGDIGRHFPDTDERFLGANSMDLLTHTVKLLRDAGFVPVNVDSTIVAQAPRLAPFMEAMRSSLAAGMGLPVAQVNVKAKTAERMGPVGEGRAMEAQAIAMLTTVAG